jgi:hypothetical protein
MTLFTKFISILILTLLVAGHGVSSSANIIEDFQKNFETKKSKIKESIREFKTQSEIDDDEQKSNLNKICEIRKGYAVKHYNSRKENRNQEIDEGIPNITKIKEILANSKQNINKLNSIADNLMVLMKQKKDLLAERIKDADAIDCKIKDKEEKLREKVKANNLQLAKIDKNILEQRRDFGLEVRRVIEAMKQATLEVKSS